MEEIVKGFGSATFGEIYAEDYDVEHDPGTTAEAVQRLAEIAGTGKILELAIGTGRVALPLARRGLTVHGIDGSPAMVAKLREKPGGEAIPVSIGDFADVDIEGSFDLVFLIFNTLFNLTSQDAQVRCFENVAKRLNSDGQFLVETLVPDVTRFDDGQSVRTLHVDMESAVLEAAVHDPVQQVVEYQRVRMTNEGVNLSPLPIRYAWPGEIDLMARVAGMKLQHRWGGWDRSPFTATSKMHVSVYRKIA